MPVKTIMDSNGRKLFLGRKRPVARGPRLSLKNYLMRSFTPGPMIFDYTREAAAALAQMYGNDVMGDCVIAAMEHLAGVLTGNSTGTPIIFPDTNTVRLYSAIGGYVPGDPSTDNGCDEVTALNYGQQNGLLADGSHKFSGWIALDGTDAVEVRTACWLFENVFFGVELPDAWITPFPSTSGFTWDAAGPSDPQNGHAFVGAAYNKQGVVISTWGMLGTLTYSAIAQYASQASGGQVYAVLSADIISKAMEKAPMGFDWSQLLADLQAIGGGVVS